MHDKNAFFKVKFEKNNIFPLLTESNKKINDKIDKNSESLGDLFLVSKGMETAANKVYGFKEYPTEFPREYIKKRLSGTNINKYYIKHKTGYLLYFEDIKNFKDLPISIKNYLKNNSQTLKNRHTVKNENRPWWK